MPIEQKVVLPEPAKLEQVWDRKIAALAAALEARLEAIERKLRNHAIN